MFWLTLEILESQNVPLLKDKVQLLCLHGQEEATSSNWSCREKRASKNSYRHKKLLCLISWTGSFQFVCKSYKINARADKQEAFGFCSQKVDVVFLWKEKQLYNGIYFQTVDVFFS